MSAIHRISPEADVISKHHALATNITAAKSLCAILKSNLGPKGTLKMLVGGAGQIKLTKDGYVLLSEMAIQHPTAALIARTAAAQDSATGDGSTTAVLQTGELLRQCEMLVAEDVHPRVLCDGIFKGKHEALKFLETFKREINPVECKDEDAMRAKLVQIASTSLKTKVEAYMADLLTDICVDACKCIKKPGLPLDLHMVEIMTMQHHSDVDTRLVKGLVLDHGARHPNMSRDSKNCFILVANVCLEFENTEVHSGFFYKNAEQREKLVKAERMNVTQRVNRIIALKNEVVGTDKDKSFILINQGGIDPISLDMFQKNNIVGIRRAKRRNMERIPLACGGWACNSTADLTKEALGWADHVYEHAIGDDKFTFLEGVKNPTSCTVLIKGAHRHTVIQIKDALRDGLRAVKNVYNDNAWIPGAGAWELACHKHLMKYAESIKGRMKLGIQALAKSMLVIPKSLAMNSGFDQQDTMLKLMDEMSKSGEAGDKKTVGLCIHTGGPIDPTTEGIWDNYCVKKQTIYLATNISCQLLSVDEVMRAGRRLKKSG